MEKNADDMTEPVKARIALLKACEKGNIDMIIRLSVAGADFHVTTNNDATPLHLASFFGHADIVHVLLNLKLNVRATDKYGETPLHAACKGNHLSVVQTLLPVKRGHSSKDNDTQYTEPDVNARDHSQNTPLHYACRKGNVNMVALLIGKNADVEANNIFKKTPLHEACFRGHAEVVEYLLNHIPSDNNLDESYFKSALTANKDSIQILKLLFTRGRCTDKLDTLLHLACYENKLKEVDFLIKQGMSVNAKPNTLENKTPLNVAVVISKSPAIVKLLIENGADVNVRDDSGKAILNHACIKGNPEVIKLLLDKAEINARDKLGNTPLHTASYYGNKDCALLLLQNGADVNAQNMRGDTPLQMANDTGSMQAVDILVEHGGVNRLLTTPDLLDLLAACVTGNIDTIVRLSVAGADLLKVKNVEGLSLLHLACVNGNATIVRFLLNMKANVNDMSPYGQTPLLVACAMNHLSVVQTLLPVNRGHSSKDSNVTYIEPDVNSRCSTTGATPLHLACQNGNVDMVALLLSNNADAQATSKLGSTPLSVACAAGHTEILEYLLKHIPLNSAVNIDTLSSAAMEAQTNCAEVLKLIHKRVEYIKTLNTNMKIFCLNGNLDGIDVLIKNGASVNAKLEGDITPLQAAIMEQVSNATVKFLLENGADPNVKNTSKESCLQIACLCDNSEQATLLLNYGADVNARDCLGNTALHWACRAVSQECVLLLVQNGADVNAKGHEGKTPLHIAYSTNRETIIDILSACGGNFDIRDDHNKTPFECVFSDNL